MPIEKVKLKFHFCRFMKKSYLYVFISFNRYLKPSHQMATLYIKIIITLQSSCRMPESLVCLQWKHECGILCTSCLQFSNSVWRFRWWWCCHVEAIWSCYFVCWYWRQRPTVIPHGPFRLVKSFYLLLIYIYIILKFYHSKMLKKLLFFQKLFIWITPRTNRSCYVFCLEIISCPVFTIKLFVTLCYRTCSSF